MAYLDIGAWSAEHVVYWFRGLHSSLRKARLDQIIKCRVNGKRLFLLNAQDIMELVPGIKVEAVQAILAGISLLRYLSSSSTQETLQSLTLNLACQARYMYNQLVQAELSPRLLPVSTTLTTPMTGTSKDRFDFTKVDSNIQINQSTKQRVSLETLEGLSIMVDMIIYMVNWLNSTSSASKVMKFDKDFKSIILRVAIELTSTAQRDQFVEQPNDVIKKTSKFLADYCEWLVLGINDADFIQPCWIDLVSVKKKIEEDDFGIVIQLSPAGLLTIEEVVFSSPAHRSGRVSVGDEIVQLDYQTVVGWPLERFFEMIKMYKSEIILTIKKKPPQSALNPSIVVIKPYAIPLKRVLSQNSDSIHTNQDDQEILEQLDERAEEEQEEIEDNGLVLEPPKEPKGPVYDIQSKKPKSELRRRVSLSGSISDAIVDLSLADSLPIPSLMRNHGPNEIRGTSKLNRITKETLTKSISHDTAKLYIHTLSIDGNHLWSSQQSKDIYRKNAQ